MFDEKFSNETLKYLEFEATQTYLFNIKSNREDGIEPSKVLLLIKRIKDLEETFDKQHTKLEKYKEALKFYADPICDYVDLAK